MNERTTIQTVQPVLLDARQAAQALSVCEKTLWSLTAPRGPLPAVRIGRSVRYRPEDLRAWAQQAAGAISCQDA